MLIVADLPSSRYCLSWVSKTVRRIGEVLSLFDVQRSEWGPTSVAKQLGISKSRAHETLSSLAEIGLLLRTGDGRYRLGWRILDLAASFRGANDLVDAATPVMRDLAGRYGTPVQLAVWWGDAPVLAHQVGEQAPPADGLVHSGAMQTALLLARKHAAKAPRFRAATPQPCTDVYGVAVPIPTPTGVLPAAIGVTLRHGTDGPSPEQIENLRRGAAAVGAALVASQPTG